MKEVDICHDQQEEEKYCPRLGRQWHKLEPCKSFDRRKRSFYLWSLVFPQCCLIEFSTVKVVQKQQVVAMEV